MEVIKGLTVGELQQALGALDLPQFRVRQIYKWMYQKYACSWEEMTNLPRALRQELSNHGFDLGCLAVIAQERAADGSVKYLFELADRQTVEAVYLPETDRQTVCISTQVGCGMGCCFCATGQLGLIRNLTPAEMIDEILRIARITGQRISNVVIMGQGEPLANYDAVLAAIRLCNDPDGPGIGARHITLSTCGLIPGIDRLAAENLQINLAISLHAADDELRNRLMPINRVYPLAELIAACRRYITKTSRRVTFEYVMMAGVNDRPQDLQGLIRLLTGLLAHVNLIPLNPVPDSKWKRSSPGRIREFAAGLADAHIEVTIRKERGSRLAAACGQLQGRRPDQ